MPDPPLRVKDAPCDADTANKVQAALESGGLVVLPTETVYGIAARGDDPKALQALAQAKGRPTEDPFTWHVGDTSCLDALGARCPSVSRLVERYWPGPLTLVLPDARNHLPHLSRGGRVGIRFPAHKATASILKSLPFPVAMTSANMHGEPPVLELGQLAPSISDNLSLLVEGEAPSTGEASTVLRLGRVEGEERPSFEILREGLHGIESLRRTAGLRILFVCTGNTCRSPMAEGLARKAIADHLTCAEGDLGELGFEISSAGIFAFGAGTASKHALNQLARRGVDLSKHRACAATAEVLIEADHIYCLTRGHLDAVHKLLPHDNDLTSSLLDPGGEDIPDPIGGSDRDYARSADLISDCIEARIKSWA